MILGNSAFIYREVEQKIIIQKPLKKMLNISLFMLFKYVNTNDELDIEGLKMATSI